MKIRNVVIDDFISIHLLNMFALGYDYPADKTKRRLAYILLKPDTKFLVAEDDGNVVGYIHADDYDCSYSEPLKSILALAVDEDYRRSGIGRALVTAIEKWAVSSGAVGVRLVTSMFREDAHRFYNACGYTVRQEQKNYIKLFEINR